MEGDIDLVYTWVEDDATHQAERAKYFKGGGSSGSSGGNIRLSGKDNNTMRFRCSREILQSIKSALCFAPFIRHIYVVCADYQQPHFLDGLSPKVHIVHHSDIFPNKTHLPVFNSHAIECHLHRIPNLAEKFLYANDDMFFGHDVRPSQFFTEDGRPILVGSGNALESTLPRRSTETYLYARYNISQLLNKYKSVASRPRIIHQIKPLTKTLCNDIWNCDLFRPALARTSMSKFRATSDVWAIGLALYYGWHRSKVTFGKISSAYYSVSDTTNLDKLFKQVRRARVSLYCLNDIMKNPGGGHLQRYRSLLATSLPHSGKAIGKTTGKPALQSSKPPMQILIQPKKATASVHTIPTIPRPAIQTKRVLPRRRRRVNPVRRPVLRTRTKR